MFTGKTLKFKFRLYILLMVSILIIVTALLLPMLLTWGEYSASRDLLTVEAAYFKERYQKDPSIDLIETAELRSFIGQQNAPTLIRMLFSLNQLKDDQVSKKQYQGPNGLQQIYLITTTLPGTKEKLYLFHCISDQIRPYHPSYNLYKLQLSYGLLAITLTILLFIAFSRQFLSPLYQLINWLNKQTPDSPPSTAPPGTSNDEIGILGQSLYQALLKKHQSQQREQEFLANASHELRTPIAIINNAIELIDYAQQLPNELAKPLARIKRAGFHMQSLTNALLNLARNNKSADKIELIDIKALVTELIGENKYLLKQHNQISIDCKKNFKVKSKVALMKISLGNLIRNAFEHSEPGKILITIKQNSFKVINPIKADYNARQYVGFGLGLAIVEKISMQENWQLVINNSTNHRATELIFHT